MQIISLLVASTYVHIFCLQQLQPKCFKALDPDLPNRICCFCTLEVKNFIINKLNKVNIEWKIKYGVFGEINLAVLR